DGVPALGGQVGDSPEGVVEVIADVGGGDFVGGDVVAQLVFGAPVQVAALELLPDQGRILGEKQDAPLESHSIRQLGHRSGLQGVLHAAKITPCRRRIN